VVEFGTTPAHSNAEIDFEIIEFDISEYLN